MSQSLYKNKAASLSISARVVFWPKSLNRLCISVILDCTMSALDVHGAADTALFSLSLFDEMTWDEFGENGDHIVPETGALTKSAWTLKDESHQKANNEFPVVTRAMSNQNFQKLSKPFSDLKSMQEPNTDLNTQQANLPSAPGNSSFNTSNTRNKTSFLTSWLSGSDGVPREGSKACKFESTSYEFEDSDYQDSGADITEGSCPFSLSEICPSGGDLECFGVPEEGKEGNLFEYGWGHNNLEDMDKLFLNDDSLGPQAFDDNSDGMLWEASSTVIGSDSIYHSIKTPLSPESRALKGDLKGLETKMEFVPCEIPIVPSIKPEFVAGAKGLSLPCTGKPCTAINDREKPLAPVDGLSKYSKSMEDDGSNTPKEVEKASRTKRHSARRKRVEERPRKQVLEVKSTLNSYKNSQANNSQLQCMPFRIQPPSSSSQDFPSPCMPRPQVLQSTVTESRGSRQCPQPVPYVHAGFGFPVHHMPIMISGTSAMPQQLQQVQSVFNSYQPLFLDASKSQKIRNIYETSSQPFIGSSTMTPQEKIEKLRWRQKMQAQLAVEDQQQKLINQHLIPDPKQVQKQQQLQIPVTFRCSQDDASGAITLAADPLVWSEGSATKAVPLREEGDDSSAATVLQQLIDIASELDTRTRLCLRDGFHRLAGSAMQRRAVANGRSSSGSSGEPLNETCGPDSPSSSERSTCNRRILTVADIVETETNPIDRFIAQLLFHKRSPATLEPVYMSPNSCAENSQELFHQNPWALQATSQPIEGYPVAVPSVVKCTSPFLQRASESAHAFMDLPDCSDSCLRLTGTSGCLSSTILQERSPLPPKAGSFGQLEVNIVDESKEACPDYENLFSYKSTNNMIRGHALYGNNEGVMGTFPQQHQEAIEERSPSSDGAMDKLLPGDQRGPLNSGNMHCFSLRDAMPSDTSLRCTIKEDVEMIELDAGAPTILHGDVDTRNMVLEPHVQVKKEPSSPGI